MAAPHGLVVVLACAAAGAATSCRRDAPAPLPTAHAFPDVGAALPPVPLASAQGQVARVEAAVEAEPNDGPAAAQSLAANTVLAGYLGLAAVATPATASAAAVADSDWFRVPAPPPGTLVTIDLRSGPACARLDLFDDTGTTLQRTAPARALDRPVLPSLGAHANATLVRVTCEPAPRGRLKKGAPAPAPDGGPYHLAVWTRAAAPDEEVEPNDEPALTGQTLSATSTLQASLAPAGDVDAFVLDFQGLPPGGPVQLGVAGVPGVALEVRILHAVTLEPLLVRTGPSGAAVAVPNLAPERLGGRPWVMVRALTGARADARYSVNLQPWLPPGCADAQRCAALLPTEREPNDVAAAAFVAASEGPVTGIVDGTGDVDWVQFVAPVGMAAAALTLTPPVGVALGLALPTPAGALADFRGPDPLQVGGVPVVAGHVLVAVRGGRGVGAPSATWRLDIEWLPARTFETEVGREEALASLWTPLHALVPVPPEIALGTPAWERSGALQDRADRDAFGLDLRARTSATGLRLHCGSDGAPGLTCRFVAASGTEVVRVVAPADAERAADVPLVVAPGYWRVEVFAERPRPSPRPYNVVVREDALALALANPVTPDADAIEALVPPGAPSASAPGLAPQP